MDIVLHTQQEEAKTEHSAARPVGYFISKLKVPKFRRSWLSPPRSSTDIYPKPNGTHFWLNRQPSTPRNHSRPTQPRRSSAKPLWWRLDDAVTGALEAGLGKIPSSTTPFGADAGRRQRGTLIRGAA